MSAHTPGPWETSVNDEGQWDVCAEGGGDMVADLADCPESAEANARLIAAAPDLLAALAGIIEIGKRDLTNPKYDAYFEEARAALKKAEGRS